MNNNKMITSEDMIFRYDGAIFLGFSIKLQNFEVCARTVDELDELAEEIHNIHEELFLILSSIHEFAVLGIPVQSISLFEILPIDMGSLNHYNEDTDLRKDSIKLLRKAREHIESVELEHARIEFVNSEPNLLAFIYDSQ